MVNSRHVGFILAGVVLSLYLATGLIQAQEMAPAVLGAGPVIPALPSPVGAVISDASVTPVPVHITSAPHGMPEAAADFEDDVIALINVERAEKGCPPLVEHSILREAAYAHSMDMVQRNFFGHTNPDGEDPSERMQEAGYIPVIWAENIAAGQSTPQEVVAVWLSSEAHRRNTLNCNYLDAGVGYYHAPGVGYWHYWTLNLGRQENASAVPTGTPTRNPLLTPAAFLPVTIE